MNNRIAKKILTCKSSLHLDPTKVNQAKAQALLNPEWWEGFDFFVHSIEEWLNICSHVPKDTTVKFSGLRKFFHLWTIK